MAAGDQWQRASGQIIVQGPTRCPNGHELKGNVSVSFERCPEPGHSGHQAWTCRRCRAVFQQSCEQATTYRPAGP